MQHNTLSPATLICEALDRIKLRTLSRPPIPPNAPATKELIEWGIAKFAYAQLAHMRTVLRGTLLLADAGIEPAVIVLCRHLYEWNMQTRYVYSTFKTHLAATDLEAAWKFFLRVSEGNNWVKNHGTKYVPEFPASDAEGSIRIKHSVNAYKDHRTQQFGTENVDDEYSYLSERSHPNAFCLAPYLKVEFTNNVSFVEPFFQQLPGVLHACMLEWSMTHVHLLALAGEDVVRVSLIKILKQIAIARTGPNDLAMERGAVPPETQTN
jgi:hypothetical protein